MASQRQQGKRLNSVSCLIHVSGGDRLREASRKFQLSLCGDFADENQLTWATSQQFTNYIMLQKVRNIEAELSWHWVNTSIIYS
jgi:hypothetical protein